MRVVRSRVARPDTRAAGRGRLPPERDLYGMESFFKVLGDSTRLRILHALLAGELCVGDLSTALGMGLSAVSHQLAVLKAGRLVRHRRDGKLVYYSLCDHHVISLLESIRVHLAEGRGRA